MQDSIALTNGLRKKMSPSLCQLQINHDQSQFSFALRATDKCPRIQGSLIIDPLNRSQLSTAVGLTKIPGAGTASRSWPQSHRF